MTDENRRDFLLRFAAAALAAGATTGESRAEPIPKAVYGPPPGYQEAIAEAKRREYLDSAEYFAKEIGARVHFALGKTSLDPEAKAQLDRQIAWLKEHPRTRIFLRGHTESRGSRSKKAYAVGARLAQAVQDYMVAAGIPPSRISTMSLGDTMPLVTPLENALNRRVEVSPEGEAP